MYPSLRLKKHEDRRLRSGHAWVYSNEVDVKQSPLGNFEPGDVVQVEDARGKPLGMASVNPATLICARLYSRRVPQALDQAFLVKRLRQALALRELAFTQPFYRLVYGESDGLPGLVVDRFDAVLVIAKPGQRINVGVFSQASIEFEQPLIFYQRPGMDAQQSFCCHDAR